MTVLLQTTQIKKSFGGIHALKGVDLLLHKGEILGLLGENGAGKSTLMKVVSGVYPHGQFSGTLTVEGQNVQFAGTKDAEHLGIAIIHQELNLFPELTVAENIFLSHFPRRHGLIDREEMNRKAQALLDQLDLKDFNAETLVKDLATGSQQMVEIAKALSKKVSVLILDEPTSSLSNKEIDKLFTVLRDFKAKGVGLIYISHKLDEVDDLCDSVLILRDGASVFTGALKNLSRHDLISHMVGREMNQMYPPKIVKATWDKPFLDVRNWNAFKLTENKMRVKNFSFQAYHGEILGVSGLMGAGRTDLFLSLFGSAKYQCTGDVLIDGKKVDINNPHQAITQGVALVTEDRKKNGLHLDFSINHNMSMAALPRMTQYGLIDENKIKSRLSELVEKLKIKCASTDLAVKTLSGGNQQKVAIAKWLMTNPRILFLDEPTRGIDVGAKFEIYSLITELVKMGLCVIIASSELPEIIGLCNRVLVMKNGELQATFVGNDINEKSITAAAFGAHQSS